MARPKLAQCFDARARRAARRRQGPRPPLIPCKVVLRRRQDTRNSRLDPLGPPLCLSPGGAFRHSQDLNVYQCLGPVLVAGTIKTLPIARCFEDPRPSAAKRGHNRSTINSRRAGRFLTISQLFAARSPAPPRVTQSINRNLILGQSPAVRVKTLRRPGYPAERSSTPLEFSAFINVMAHPRAAPNTRDTNSDRLRPHRRILTFY